MTTPEPGEVWVNDLTGHRWQILDRKQGLVEVQATDRTGAEFYGTMEAWELATFAHREETH